MSAPLKPTPPDIQVFRDGTDPTEKAPDPSAMPQTPTGDPFGDSTAGLEPCEQAGPTTFQYPPFTNGQPFECRGCWMTESDLKNYGRSRYWWLWPIFWGIVSGLGALTAWGIMR